MITAHGGAMGTGRNTKRYFDGAASYGAECLEVDIRHNKKGELVLAHMPIVLGIKKLLPLSYAFKVIRENNLRLNCDVKEKNMAKEVVELAEKEGVLVNILFTGSVSLDEAKALSAGDVYFNAFNFDIPFTPENVTKLKEIVETARGKGINLSYKSCSEAFVKACVEGGLALSVYTIDDADMQQSLLKAGVFNVTTNRPDTACAAAKRLNK